MPNLITKYNPNRCDAYENIATKLLYSDFFPWLCLLLTLTYKNWKKPIIIIMILHWFLRDLGNMFEGTLYLQEKFNEHWPFGNKQWLSSYGIASVFWCIGEVIADWYLLMRTRAIIRKKEELRWVFITCGIINIVKCAQIYTFLSYVPFRDNKYIESVYVLDMAENKFLKWSNVAIQQLCSLAYDISVIIALKKNVFNGKERLSTLDKSGYLFYKKFKQISVYRIYLSIIVTICGMPIIFMYSLMVIYYRNSSISYDDKERIEAVRVFIDDSTIDPLRVLVLNFNYTFMYIDQILLRFYVEQNNSSKRSSSAQSKSMNNGSQKSSSNFNMVYHDYKNYDSFETNNSTKSLVRHDNRNYNDFETRNSNKPNSSYNNFETRNSNKPNLNSKPMYYNIVFNNNDNLSNDIDNSKTINYYNNYNNYNNYNKYNNRYH